jgi:hypothetical protein
MQIGMGLPLGDAALMGGGAAAPIALLPWPWLPDVTVAANGQTGTLLRHGSSAITVRNSGSAWVDAASGAEIALPRVPFGATLVMDHANNYYYWGGTERTKSALTSVSVGGKIRHRLDGVNLGLTNEVTVLMEWVCPDKIPGGASPYVGTPGIFCLANTSYAQRFEFQCRTGTSVDGNMTVYQGRVGGSASTDNWAIPINYPLTTGRRRFVYSGPSGSGPILGVDGWPVTTGTNSGAGTFNVNRLSFGYRAIGTGTIDLPIQSDAMYNSLRVIVWPYAMSADEVEAAIDFSEHGLLPLILMHDSYGMSYGTADQNNIGIGEQIKQADAQFGYRAIRESTLGGTGWYLNNGANTCFTDRLAAMTDRYRKYSLAVLEKWDENGATISTGIDAARAWLGHERWCVADTAFGLGDYPGGSNPAGAALYAAARPIVEAKCGTEHWISLYDWMRLHVVVGTDEPSLANGTWLTSQFNMPDTVHLNGVVGYPLYAQQAYAEMSRMGLLASGHWL